MLAPISGSSDTGLTIFSACDERYAVGLRVALFSALETLGQTARVVVGDGGLRDPDGWARRFGAHPRCGEVRVVSADMDRLRSLPCQELFGPVSWLRLFLSELLPDLDRVIHIDADVLVRADLAELWAQRCDGAPVSAVRDYLFPTFASGLPNAVSALGLPPSTPYFNAGVLLLDLAAWRRASLTERAIDYAREYGDTIRYADQDALNAVAAGTVHELAPRWNVQLGTASARTTLAHLRSAGDDPSIALRALADRAAVIHFTAFKPWQPQGLRASRWSIGLHLAFARTTLRFSDRSRAQSLADAMGWGARLLRRVPTALRRRLPG
jgi:lipopolysaccharide biosynthesis glycosyltransferase